MLGWDILFQHQNWISITIPRYALTCQPAQTSYPANGRLILPLLVTNLPGKLYPAGTVVTLLASITRYEFDNVLTLYRSGMDILVC